MRPWLGCTEGITFAGCLLDWWLFSFTFKLETGLNDDLVSSLPEISLRGRLTLGLLPPTRLLLLLDLTLISGDVARLTQQF